MLGSGLSFGNGLVSSSAGLVNVLGQSAVAAPRNSVNGAGDAVAQTMATITIPAGAMGRNGSVRITSVWSYTNSANAKTIATKFGGTSYAVVSPTTTADNRIQTQIFNRNATNSQIGNHFQNQGGWGSSASALVTSAIDTTAAVNITLTCNWAGAVAAETITLEAYCVEIMPGA